MNMHEAYDYVSNLYFRCPKSRYERQKASVSSQLASYIYYILNN